MCNIFVPVSRIFIYLCLLSFHLFLNRNPFWSFLCFLLLYKVLFHFWKIGLQRSAFPFFDWIDIYRNTTNGKVIFMQNLKKGIPTIPPNAKLTSCLWARLKITLRLMPDQSLGTFTDIAINFPSFFYKNGIIYTGR